MKKTRVEIFKKGEWIELVLKEKSIKYNTISNKIGSLQERKISHSNTFSLPYVSENIEALDINLFSPTLMAEALNRKYPARYYVRDKKLQEGFLVINNTLDGSINVNFIDEALIITDEWGKRTFRQLLYSLGEDISKFPKSILSTSYITNINILKDYETDKTKKVLPTPYCICSGDDPSIENKKSYIARYPNPLNNIGDKFNIDSQGVRKVDSFNPFQSRPIFSFFSFLYIICQAFGYRLRLDSGVDFELLRDSYLTNEGVQEGTPPEDSFISSDTPTIPLTYFQRWQFDTRGPGANDNEGFYEVYFTYPDTSTSIDAFGKKTGVSSLRPNELGTFVPSKTLYLQLRDVRVENCIVQIEKNPFIGKVIWTGTIKRRTPDNRFKWRDFKAKAVWKNSLGVAFEVDFAIDIETTISPTRTFKVTGNKEQLNNTPVGGVEFVGLILRVIILHEDEYYNDFPDLLDSHFVETLLPPGRTDFDSYGQFLKNKNNLLKLSPDISIKELLSNILQQQGLLLFFQRDSNGVQNIVKLSTYGSYRDRVREARALKQSSLSMWNLDSYVGDKIYFTRVYGSDTSMTVETSLDGISWSRNTAGVTSPRTIGLYPADSFIRLQSTSDGSYSNVIQVGRASGQAINLDTKFYDWSEYHQKNIAPQFSTDFGNQYGEVNEISLSNPFPGNVGNIQISTNTTNKGYKTKLIPLAKNEAKSLNDVSLVTSIYNTQPYFEYTNKKLGAVRCSFDQYLPGTRKQYNAEQTTSSINACELPLLSNLIYSDGFLPIGIKEWYYLVDVSLKCEAVFLLPISVVKTFDISLPIYVETLGGFYIVEEIGEYEDDLTPVKVNLIKLPL